MAKTRLILAFTEPEDMELLELLKKEAKTRRYPVEVFALLSLHEAFQHLMEGNNGRALGED